MKVLVAKALEDLKELVNQFSDDYEVYVNEEIQMESDPISLKKPWEAFTRLKGKNLWKLK